ncbi:MAG: UbiD family decarboxylase [Candidatus Hodarchaeales archaeon]|jgi:UbiD family decarboxylase
MGKNLKSHIKTLEETNNLLSVKKEVSKNLEAAGVLAAVEPKPVLFNSIKESDFRVAGNLFCTKDQIAFYFGIPTTELIPKLTAGIEQRQVPEEVSAAPCQEVVMDDVDLDKLPLLLHNERDGGPYISSAVVVASHPEHGQNLDFHRAMQFDKSKLAVRIVRGRDFDAYLNDLGEIDVAFCIGNTPNVLAAAAISVDRNINELEIANALEELAVVKAKSVDLLIPANCEFVLEGRITLEEKHDEGPFIDLTETYDVVRQEPVLEVKTITHRKDAIWQALLPGAGEHKVLMGMPREPTMFKKVNEAGVNCIDVNVNPGGCSWLHAIVRIDKQTDEDGKKAIDAAFAGHRSCKHIFVVDKDINIYDPLQVEWAMATRFQGDIDLKVLDKEPGSSLDPSAEPGTKMTTKIGFDLTAPLVTKGKSFARTTFPQVDLKKYLED